MPRPGTRAGRISVNTMMRRCDFPVYWMAVYWVCGDLPCMTLRGIVANNLRRLRAEKKVTQEELADRAGLNRKYPSLLENEHYAASVDVLEKLAIALDVDPVELFRKNS